MNSYIVVLITSSNKEEAIKIANKLIGERLAACVNIIENITSLFWWKAKIDRSQETLLLVKSSKVKLKAIIKAVKSLHSYEVPEIIALTITGGYRPYLKWIDDSLRQPL
jgi:periplasmic divalent cation tolerance protein